MSAAKHTPGPWQAERVYFSEAMKDDPALRIVSLSADRYIAELSFTAEEDGCHVADVEQMRANARLIAAAPALLAALEEALEFIEDQVDVVDGPDGRPQANRAMRLAETLSAAIRSAS